MDQDNHSDSSLETDENEVELVSVQELSKDELKSAKHIKELVDNIVQRAESLAIQYDIDVHLPDDGHLLTEAEIAKRKEIEDEILAKRKFFTSIQLKIYELNEISSDSETYEQLAWKENDDDSERNILPRKLYQRACKVYDVPCLENCMKAVESDTVDLSNTSLGLPGIKAAIRSFRFSRTLKHLILPGNKLGPQSMKVIAHYFEKYLPKITHLNLANNMAGKKCGKYINLILEFAVYLEFLDLSENGIDSGQLELLYEHLDSHWKLRELNLSYNNLKEDIGRGFGKCLARNGILQWVNVKGNEIKNGAASIFDGLKRNKALKSFIISQNGIDKSSCHNIGKSLEINISLLEVDLSDNKINSYGMDEISKGIKKNKTLKALNLARNSTDGQGALRLLHAISTADNKIEELNLSGIRVTLSFLKLWHSIKMSGRELKIKYGHLVHYSIHARNVNSHQEITENNPLVQVVRIAEDKGISLKNLLSKGHAQFLKKHKADLLKLKTEENASTVSDKHPKEEISIHGKFPRIEVENFIQFLVKSDIKVPEELSRRLAEQFSDSGTIDFSDVITSIPSTIDYLEFEKEPVTVTSKTRKKHPKKALKKKK